MTASDHYLYQKPPPARTYLCPCGHARTQRSNPIGLVMSRLTLCMKMGVRIAMRPSTASYEHFRHDKGSGQQQQSPQVAMRPGTASHSLRHSENAEATAITTGSDAARHRILPTRQVGLINTEQVTPLAAACQAIRKQRTDTTVGRGFTSTTDKPDTPAKGQHVVSLSLQRLLHSSAINTNPKPGLRYLFITLSLLLLSHFASQANY